MDKERGPLSKQWRVPLITQGSFHVLFKPVISHLIKIKEAITISN